MYKSKVFLAILKAFKDCFKFLQTYQFSKKSKIIYKLTLVISYVYFQNYKLWYRLLNDKRKRSKSLIQGPGV